MPDRDTGYGPRTEHGAGPFDARVIVRVKVVREVLEPRADVDGHEDYYVIKRDVVSDREWVETREKALGKPECLCRCGADAIGSDDEGRWACGRHIEPPEIA